ncbi:MAG: sigma-E processing peptidase SpoIIGA [Oscillospiraceae bacterium]|nr:sigma-E processing peptidase SpoIIGA [Oscillospiraceae bacterium]
MVKTIYADVFFLINFIINYLILFTSGYISARYICRWKLFLAASIGAVYGFTVFLPAFPLCTSLPVKLFISCLMVFTSFGSAILLKILSYFWQFRLSSEVQSLL